MCDMRWHTPYACIKPFRWRSTPKEFRINTRNDSSITTAHTLGDETTRDYCFYRIDKYFIMSTDNNNNNSSSRNNDDDNNKSSVSTTIPNWNEIKMKIRSSIKSSVQIVNNTLASLEDKTKQMKQPIQHQLSIIGKQSSLFVAKGINIYETERYEYGPYLVAGTSIFVLTIGALRRSNRYMTLFSALLSGAVTYGVIYENPFENNTNNDSRKTK